MKYSDQYFYDKLEINELFKIFYDYVVLPNTKELVENIKPFNNVNDIKEELNIVDEAFAIINRFERAPIYNTLDVLHLLDTCLKGGILSGLELYEFVLMSSNVRSLLRLQETMDKANFKTPHFKDVVSTLTIDNAFDKVLRNTVDDNGEILDSASPELHKIRSRLKGIDDRIKAKLNEIINANHNMLAESMVVLRDDRYCVCVKAEYKNVFRGVLHDVSSSNLTAYMEPLVVVEMEREKEKLKNEEKEEINKILRTLSVSICGLEESFRKNFECFIHLDYIFGKALLGRTYDGCAPEVNDQGILDLKNARHPLLKVKNVIPNNVNFGKYRGIVITGPNTGGKTVLLKTVGLLSLMVKFGFLIPADKESNVMVYDHIFCDIGDDQSIKENLSTFSSHMKKMVTIVNGVTPNSLALFDEIGSGTDPNEGGAIAIGVLKYFLSQKVSFIVTTHYASLKAFAYSEKRVVNASMEFNQDTYLPTYHLKIGKSGSSNAFSIAQNLGLKKVIIKMAKESVSTNNDDVDSLIHNIERRSNELYRLEQELKNKISENEALQASLDQKLNKFDKEKEHLLKVAELKANKQIENKLEQANQLLEELKALKEKGVKMHEIIDAQAKVDEKLSNVSISKKKKVIKPKVEHDFIVGDRVYLVDYANYGNIVRIRKNNTLDVSIGNIRINVSKDELEYVEPVENEQVASVEIIRSKSPSSKVSLSLDLRGERAADALELIDKYIDELLINNLKQATIIHGFGTGAVREMVQNYLKKCPYVKEYRYGGAGEGGLGATVITLK